MTFGPYLATRGLIGPRTTSVLFRRCCSPQRRSATPQHFGQFEARGDAQFAIRPRQVTFNRLHVHEEFVTIARLVTFAAAMCTARNSAGVRESTPVEPNRRGRAPAERRCEPAISTSRSALQAEAKSHPVEQSTRPFHVTRSTNAAPKSTMAAAVSSWPTSPPTPSPTR